MCLVDRGIDRFHFYTLNRAPLTQAVCHLLGHVPVQQAAASIAQRGR
jgi:methylenetetrahydrofolate reductase (NADPH)